MGLVKKLGITRHCIAVAVLSVVFTTVCLKPSMASHQSGRRFKDPVISDMVWESGSTGDRPLCRGLDGNCVVNCDGNCIHNCVSNCDLNCVSNCDTNCDGNCVGNCNGNCGVDGSCPLNGSCATDA